MILIPIKELWSITASIIQHVLEVKIRFYLRANIEGRKKKKTDNRKQTDEDRVEFSPP